MRLIIGEKYTDEIRELTDLGCEIITFKPSQLLDEEINSHADISFFKCFDNQLVINSEVKWEIEPFLTDLRLVECKGIKSPYPNDVALNCALIGKYLLCNTKYAAEEIKAFCKSNSIELLHTNQGYSKCSVCVLNENAVITECSAIASLLKIYQIDVLKISAGHVALSDSHYGFIGGASGMINDNTLYFSGNISTHPDYEVILKFLDKYNIKPVFNKSRKLSDFGGFIKL
ncbi:MAG: hypothetical protein J6Q83_07615 [Clostridia bacterium]|nr:hypothetical protein [Clostridia bacterium]